MPTLRTARLVLRPIAGCDEAALHQFWTNPEVRRYLWENRILSRENVAEIIQASQQYFLSAGSGFFIIELAERPGELVGFCGHRKFEQDGGVELLYAITPEHWGEGLVTEAATEVLRYGFEECGFNRVVGVTDTPNQRSVNVMQRLGMVFLARREWHGLDTVFYEIEKADFEPQ